MSTPLAHGHVWLVGAGPGDPELITLKAVRVLGEADVILVDDLANPALLTHAHPQARVVRVGKRGGCKSTPQAFIDRLMIREATRGKRVVRLKGGDPNVFGRAGEELAACRTHGIACEIVPGITSATAAAAALNVPLTHRDHGHGVAFITGHPKPGAPDVDWAALAQSGLTLVVYMGITRAAQIQSALIAGGLRRDTPAAVVQRASAANERALVTTLASLDRDLAHAHMESPAILIIGTLISEARAQLDRRHTAQRAAG